VASQLKLVAGQLSVCMGFEWLKLLV